MKLLLINVVCGIKSTGKICTDIAEYMTKNAFDVRIAYGREVVPPKYAMYAKRIGSTLDVFLHGIRKLLLDGDGTGSVKATKKLIDWIIEYDPDIIHLHNILGCYINIPLLFSYLKQANKKIIWTLHDCSAFTGGCGYFEFFECYRWRTGCGHCPQMGIFPKRRLIDASAKKLQENIKIYGHLRNLTIVTPSHWLKKYVKESFLGHYRIEVIHNGVDTSMFYHRESFLRERLNISEKYVILGVASPWSERKGFKDFINLSKLLPIDEYRIVLIGLSEKQIRMLPSNVLGIQKTYNIDELAEYYSMADVFVNATYDDNYPTTNLEAIACETPVITYNTGGSGESASLYGSFVEKGDILALRDAIENFTKINTIRPQKLSNLVSIEKMVLQYKELYELS